jgi:hypothetical protein
MEQIGERTQQLERFGVDSRDGHFDNMKFNYGHGSNNGQLVSGGRRRSLLENGGRIIVRSVIAEAGQFRKFTSGHSANQQSQQERYAYSSAHSRIKTQASYKTLRPDHNQIFTKSLYPDYRLDVLAYFW